MKIKNIGLYFSSNIIKGLFPFLLLPILTNVMSVEEFGIVGIFQTFLITLTPIIGLKAFGSASIRFYQNTENLAIYNNSCIQILTIMLMLLISVALMLTGMLDGTGLSSNLLLLCILCSAMKYMSEFRLSQWMIREEVSSYTKFQMFEALMSFLVTICFIYIIKDKVDARVSALFFVSILFSSIALHSMVKDNLLQFSSIFKPNLKYIKECLSYGVPLLPHALSGIAIITVDRYMIGYYLGFEKLGLYMFAVTLASVVSVFFISVNQVYSPWLYKNLASISSDKLTRIKLCTLVVFLISIVVYSIGINFLEFLIPIISNVSYLSSLDTLKIIMLGQLCNGFYLLVINFVLYDRRTKIISTISVTCVVVNVLLLLFLVPEFGIVGAAYSFLVANLIKFFATAVCANNVISNLVSSN